MSSTASGLKVLLTSKWRPFWKFWNILDRFILTSDIERPSETNPPQIFFDVDDVTVNVTAWRQSRVDTGDGYLFSLHVKMPVHAILLIFKQVKHQYDLQYFSCHYHHYNEHYISKFWQVRNLWLPFHLFVCLCGNFTKSQERLSQSSPNLVKGKH